MKISPINSCSPSSKARFPKSQLETLITASKTENREIHKLYTLLDLLDKYSGKAAKFTTEVKVSKYRALGNRGSFYPSSMYKVLYIDNVEVKRGTGTEFDVLKRAVTDYQTKDGTNICMPLSVFDKICWDNRDKTVEDVRKLALD